MKESSTVMVIKKGHADLQGQRPRVMANRGQSLEQGNGKKNKREEIGKLMKYSGQCIPHTAQQTHTTRHVDLWEYTVYHTQRHHQAGLAKEAVFCVFSLLTPWISSLVREPLGAADSIGRNSGI